MVVKEGFSQLHQVLNRKRRTEEMNITEAKEILDDTFRFTVGDTVA